MGIMGEFSAIVPLINYFISSKLRLAACVVFIFFLKCLDKSIYIIYLILFRP